MDENELAKVIRDNLAWYDYDQVKDDISRRVAKALLKAGYAKRSDVVEECAKVCDGESLFDGRYKKIPGYHVEGNCERGSVAFEVSEALAIAIRNLKDKQ